MRLAPHARERSTRSPSARYPPGTTAAARAAPAQPDARLRSSRRYDSGACAPSPCFARSPQRCREAVLPRASTTATPLAADAGPSARPTSFGVAATRHSGSITSTSRGGDPRERALVARPVADRIAEAGRAIAYGAEGGRFERVLGIRQGLAVAPRRRRKGIFTCRKSCSPAWHLSSASIAGGVAAGACEGGCAHGTARDQDPSTRSRRQRAGEHAGGATQAPHPGRQTHRGDTRSSRPGSGYGVGAHEAQAPAHRAHPRDRDASTPALRHRALCFDTCPALDAARRIRRCAVSPAAAIGRGAHRGVCPRTGERRDRAGRGCGRGPGSRAPGGGSGAAGLGAPEPGAPGSGPPESRPPRIGSDARS